MPACCKGHLKQPMGTLCYKNGQRICLCWAILGVKAGTNNSQSHFLPSYTITSHTWLPSLSGMVRRLVFSTIPCPPLFLAQPLGLGILLLSHWILQIVDCSMFLFHELLQEVKVLLLLCHAESIGLLSPAAWEPAFQLQQSQSIVSSIALTFYWNFPQRSISLFKTLALEIVIEHHLVSNGLTVWEQYLRKSLDEEDRLIHCYQIEHCQACMGGLIFLLLSWLWSISACSMHDYGWNWMKQFSLACPSFSTTFPLAW